MIPIRKFIALQLVLMIALTTVSLAESLPNTHDQTKTLNALVTEREA